VIQYHGSKKWTTFSGKSVTNRKFCVIFAKSPLIGLFLHFTVYINYIEETIAVFARDKLYFGSLLLAANLVVTQCDHCSNYSFSCAMKHISVFRLKNIEGAEWFPLLFGIWQLNFLMAFV